MTPNYSLEFNGEFLLPFRAKYYTACEQWLGSCLLHQERYSEGIQDMPCDGH